MDIRDAICVDKKKKKHEQNQSDNGLNVSAGFQAMTPAQFYSWKLNLPRSPEFENLPFTMLTFAFHANDASTPAVTNSGPMKINTL